MSVLHSEAVFAHLAKRVFQAMMQPHSPTCVYEPKMAKFVAPLKTLKSKDHHEKTPKADDPTDLDEKQQSESEAPTILDKLKLMLQNREGEPR